MSNEKFFNRGLPKWPQLMIVGEDVTPLQAKEIIFRTDDFVICPEYKGNNKKFTDEYAKLCGFYISDEEKFSDNKKCREIWDLKKFISDKISRIELGYVQNDWGVSCYVYGPHGFCSPEGKIYFQENVGKWPNVEDIYDDFVNLAKAFPFLKFKASLYDGEHCEENTSLVVSFIVENGHVTMTDGDFDLKSHYEEKPFLFLDRNELGYPFEWYEEFADRIHSIVDEYHELYSKE